MTPLHVAAKGNRAETVESLVCQGSKIDIKDKNGVSIQGTLVILMTPH